MTSSEEHTCRTGLKLWAHDARARSAAYAIQAAQAAQSAAVRRQWADHMIGRIAGRNPQYAERLLAIGVIAEGRRAALDARHHSPAADRPGGQLLPQPRNDTEAGVIAEPQATVRETGTVHERGRIVGELHDEVVRRVYGAGLTLAGTVELQMEPEAHWRIEAACDELDAAIRILRDATFNPATGRTASQAGLN